MDTINPTTYHNHNNHYHISKNYNKESVLHANMHFKITMHLQSGVG